MKGLKAETLGVLFHHFLKMTTESRWRNSGVVGESHQHRELEVLLCPHCVTAVILSIRVSPNCGDVQLSDGDALLSLNPDYNSVLFEYILNFITEKLVSEASAAALCLEYVLCLFYTNIFPV